MNKQDFKAMIKYPDYISIVYLYKVFKVYSNFY